jgi:ribosomal protein S18 acetylase RimI-like enzyme
MTEVREVRSEDEPAVERFLARIPEGDRTFFKEDVTDPDVIAFWGRRGGVTNVALDGGEVVGYGAVIPLQGWSSHVGEVRVIVDPGHRRQGVGRALGRQAVLSGVGLGLEKLVVEVIADQEPTIAMFRSLGFDPEALLEDQVRDQVGELHDLMILGLSVAESAASLQSTGIADGLVG